MLEQPVRSQEGSQPFQPFWIAQRTTPGKGQRWQLENWLYYWSNSVGTLKAPFDPAPQWQPTFPMIGPLNSNSQSGAGFVPTMWSAMEGRLLRSIDRTFQLLQVEQMELALTGWHWDRTEHNSLHPSLNTPERIPSPHHLERSREMAILTQSAAHLKSMAFQKSH